MGQPWSKENASEAGHHRVAGCGPFGSRHSHRAGPAHLLIVEFDIDSRTSCLCDLSLAGAHHVASSDICLPPYSASTKVAGGLNYDYVVPVVARAIFRGLTFVRAAEGNATTAAGSSQ